MPARFRGQFDRGTRLCPLPRAQGTELFHGGSYQRPVTFADVLAMTDTLVQSTKGQPARLRADLFVAVIVMARQIGMTLTPARRGHVIYPAQR